MNQKNKDAVQAKWKLRDPDGFATQELRRKNYFEMKRKDKVIGPSVAMPVLQFKMFLYSKNEFFDDDPHDIDDPAVSWSLGKGEVLSTPQVAAAAVPTSRLQGIVVTGDAVAQIA